MSELKKRKQACARLGIELQNRYEAMVTASGEDEIAMAAVNLGQLFNDNIEFIIWNLKKSGGLNVPGPEKIRKPITTASSELPSMPAILSESTH